YYTETTTGCAVLYGNHYGLRAAPTLPARASRKMQVLSLERPGLVQTAAVSLVTLAALALAATVLAHWTWARGAPHAEPRAAPAAEPTSGITSAQNLFGTLQRERNAAAPTGIAVKLLGVVAASRGRRGYAVIQIEGRDILAVA